MHKPVRHWKGFSRIYLQEQPDVPLGTTVTINELLNHTTVKRFHSLKQSRVSDYFDKFMD